MHKTYRYRYSTILLDQPYEQKLNLESFHPFLLNSLIIFAQVTFHPHQIYKLYVMYKELSDHCF